ncbi:MAG TPA: alpha-2-macroglobulin family protein [Candidatus Wallbacteria bacterium]|nr:alpha-2-macroglobulin family protein [Candidatus Wallbacteria bacterium]
MNSIKARSMSIKAEKAVPPDSEFYVDVNYKNIENVSFRAYKEDWKEYLKDANRRNFNWVEYSELMNTLKKGRPAAEWSETLKPTQDYKPADVKIKAPGLKPGFYRIFASAKKDFSESDNCIQHCLLWVSDISVVARPRDGYVEGFVLQSVSGAPIKSATVKLYSTREEYRGNRYVRETEIVSSVQTDENGQFSVEYKQMRNYYSGYMIYASDDKGSEIFDPNGFSSYRTGLPGMSQSAFIFTDRAIYRPGQTINFKGIAVTADRNTANYSVAANRKVVVAFKDKNYQQIEKLELMTNDYGSFSGSFTAPADRGTGSFHIQSEYISGHASVRVEEYKRPKFSVEIKKPEKGFKLGGEVEVEGAATAYTGAPIDSATVKYRVVREVRMPYWFDFYFRGYAPRRYESRQIVNGSTRTGVDGKFKIKFNAAADEKISRGEDPTFDFRVYADVTDSAGETRSADASVKLGYKAMEAVLSAGEWQTSDKAVSIAVQTNTLDGAELDSEGAVEIYSLKQPSKPVKAELNPEYFYYWFFEFQKKSDKGMALSGDENTSNWSLWPVNDIVEKKPFNKKKGEPLSLEFNLKPGVYKAVLSTTDAFGNKISAFVPFIVNDLKAEKFGVRVPQYFVSRSQSVEIGDKYQGFWGSGYESGRAFVEIIRDNKIISKYWTPAAQTAHVIEVPVGEEMRGGFTVLTTFVRENRLYTEQVKVDVPWSNKRYDISFETFRSKLLPGQNETWSIKVKGPGAEFKAAEFLASLYDESLDAFVKHNWPSFSGLFKRDLTSVGQRFSNALSQYSVCNSFPSQYVGIPSRTYDAFLFEITQNFFGYDYYDDEEGFSGGGGRMLKREVSRSKSVSFDMADGAVPSPQSVMPSAKMSMADAEEKRDVMKSKEAAAEPGQAEARPAGPDLSKVAARSNLNETAFFFPHLTTDADGAVKITFTMPEALTRWHFMGFAHGRGLESGLIEEHAVTQKDLMVQPNPPRFIREGDELEFSVKVTNMVEKDIKGSVRFTLMDPVTEKPVDDMFLNKQTDQAVEIPAKQSKSYYWRIKAPDRIDMVKFKAVAAAGDQSDGEEGLLPVLSRRIYVQEAIPLPIRNAGEKKFKFEKLLNSGKSDTLQHKGFTVQMTSNPSWYAIQALPFLMEFPHECSEQTFNRLYANALAKHVADSDAKIRRVFDLWKGTDALKSNLEKNEQLKSVMLLESPWVLQAQSETQAKKNVGILFDDNRLKNELKGTYEKLKNMQLGDGSWPWFPGGYSNSYITLYIVTGFGRMKNLEINLVSFDLAVKALRHLDMWLDQIYRDILKYGHKNQNNLSSTIALYLYGRSFFLKDQAVAPEAKEALDYFLGQAREYWLKLDSRMSQGHLALALNRFGDKETAKKIMASIKERSQSSEEMGMYWSELEISWWWQRAPIETQALMIEAFSEVMDDKKSVEDCKVWLLKQKQTQDWKTTTATADSIYALICRGDNLLASDALVEVSVGGVKVEPEKVEAGTGFYEKRYDGSSVKPEFGDITVKKTDAGVAWGGAHWQYMEDMSKITPHTQNPLTLKKSVFVKRETKAGPVIEPVGASLEVGDLLTIRIELRTDRDMEYVHMKDQRGSGLEPVNVLSQYKYQDGLRYYESTKDTATHFYIDYLPKGTYVFEYQLRVQHRGKYQNGMAHIECMYAPEFNSHSASVVLEIK